MRSTISVCLKKDAAAKMLKVKDVLEDMYGLNVSKTGRSIEGIAEDLDDAGEVYPEIKAALYEGEADYV